MRQIVDFQAQCDKIIQTNEIENYYHDLEKYNAEIKKYLLQNCKEELITNHVKSIPSLSLSSIEKSKVTFFEKILFLLQDGELSNSSLKNEDLINLTREIRDKYASLEFLLKNHLS